MHTPELRESGRWRALAGACLALALAVAVVAIWLRNRDILRDLYDYSTVVTAAGKVGAGLRPYTDVRSPMQTSVYYLNWATEMVFGQNYLALTWGGLVQALGGGLAMAWLLWRRLGPVGAVLLAGAVTLAGLIQHVVFFYNPIGILCFAITVTGVALQPSLWPLRTPTVWLVLTALVLGGTNKLNFQGLAMLLAGLLVLRAWAARQLGFGEVGRSAAILVCAGLVVPITLELLWTGASFGQWWQEVVVQPSARRAAMAQAWNPQLLLRPPHDMHHHLLIRPIGGVGLVLLLATGAWALWPSRRDQVTRTDRMLRVLLVAAGAASGALLMVTNVESALLTSLPFLLVATAVYLACRPVEPSPADRWAGRVLATSAAVWGVVGGYAAWHGSRVLYAAEPPARFDYVRLEKAPHALAYFEGVRFPGPLLASMRDLAGRVEQMEKAAGGMRGILFGPAVEWLERAYPEAIVRNMPIWYDDGTSLSEGDAAWFESVLHRSGVRRIVSDQVWENWPPSLARAMRRNYRIERVGERFRLYHPRRPRGAVPVQPEWPRHSQDEFRHTTGSNVLLSATAPVHGMTVQPGPRGGFFGRRGGSSWAWPIGPAIMRGRATAVVNPGWGGPGTITFRIIAGPRGASEVLWEMPVSLRPGQRLVDLPFFIRPMGRPLQFEVQADDALAANITAGWRQLVILQAGEFRPTPALPVAAGLRRHPGPPGKQGEIWFTPSGEGNGPAGWQAAPFENWRRQTRGLAPMRFLTEFVPGPAGSSPEVTVTLGWYRAGRFEVMSHQTVNILQKPRLVLESSLPEMDGWVGVLVSPNNAEATAPRARVHLLSAGSDETVLAQ